MSKDILFDAEKIAKERWYSPVYELKQVGFVVGWRAMVDFKAVCAGLLLWGRPSLQRGVSAN
jgi:hypothetical protein